MNVEHLDREEYVRRLKELLSVLVQGAESHVITGQVPGTVNASFRKMLTWERM